MALIQQGSFEDVSATIQKETLPQSVLGALGDRAFEASGGALWNFKTLRMLRQVTRVAQPSPLTFTTSDTPRGLALKSIRLTEGFDGFMSDVFNEENEVFFLAWAWDYSGKSVQIYPEHASKPQEVIIPLVRNKTREFSFGRGIPLFPARHVVGGLAMRIQIWESDQGVRDFGKTMVEVTNTIQASELNSLLNLISLAAGVPIATVKLIEEASLQLAEVIGAILQANSNDYVDLFSGFYPSGDPWELGDDSAMGHAAKIVLSKFS